MKTGFISHQRRKAGIVDDRLFIMMCITMVVLAVLGYVIGKTDGYSTAMQTYIAIMNEFAEAMDGWVQKDEENE